MEQRRINGISALEMTMRDVLDGMEDLSSAAGLSASLADLEILSIEPPHVADRATPQGYGERDRPRPAA